MDFTGVLFFNHLCGNSLKHFHFHYSIYDIKINKIINSIIDDTFSDRFIKHESSDKLYTIIDDKNIKYLVIALNECMKGIILISNNKKELLESIHGLININKDRGNYFNLAFYSSKEKNYKIGFFPRQNIASKYGSSELSGYIISNTYLKGDEVNDIEQNMQRDCYESTFDFQYLKQLVYELLGNTYDTKIVNL